MCVCACDVMGKGEQREGSPPPLTLQRNVTTNSLENGLSQHGLARHVSARAGLDTVDGKLVFVRELGQELLEELRLARPPAPGGKVREPRNRTDKTEPELLPRFIFKCLPLSTSLAPLHRLRVCPGRLDRQHFFRPFVGPAAVSAAGDDEAERGESLGVAHVTQQVVGGANVPSRCERVASAQAQPAEVEDAEYATPDRLAPCAPPPHHASGKTPCALDSKESEPPLVSLALEVALEMASQD